MTRKNQNTLIQKYKYAQPKYDSEKPKYAHICLVALGRVRIWVVRRM